MRKLFIISIALAAFIVAGTVSAATTVTLNDIPASNIYPSEFDQLVLDFDIQTGSSDTLNALTLMNLGLARNSYEITKIVLWQDDGDGAFEGWGQDINLGAGVWNDSNNYWYWQNLSAAVLVTKRFFVSIETNYRAYITSDRTVQMEIPKIFDANGNGVFDLGDLGMFMASKNSAPPVDLVNTSVQTIRTLSGDNAAPKVIITDPVNQQSISSSTYTIIGQSRDQGESGVSDIQITIDGVNKGSVNDTGTNFTTWQYVWNNIADGSHTISIYSIDGYGNSGIGPVITVTKTTSTVQPPTPTPVPEQPKNFAFGDLIKGSGSTIYYYGNNGQRYVFPNEKTFKTWYSDYSTVKTISDSDLAAIPLVGNVTYKPGVKLVKITTDPKVYAVGPNGLLRWITSEALAAALYGSNWTSKVDDIPDAFFVNYNVGSPIYSAADYDPYLVMTSASSINVDKGL